MIKQFFVAALFLMPLPAFAERNRAGENIMYGYNQPKKLNVKLRKKKLANSEEQALRLLCKIGFNPVGRDSWANDDINAAISTIAWGRHWPENAMTTAYKTCNFPDFGGKPSYPHFLENIELTKLNVGQCILANVGSVDARLGAIEGEFGSENGIINLTNNYSLYLFRSLKDKDGNWKIHKRSNPISLSDANRMFKPNDPINLCLKFEPNNCSLRANDHRGNIYSITNRRTKEKRYGHIGFKPCSGIS